MIWTRHVKNERAWLSEVAGAGTGSSQRRVMPVAAGRRRRRVEVYECIAENGVVVTCHMLDMVCKAPEASRHVDKEAGPVDKTYYTG
jgi:hypothetical protein